MLANCLNAYISRDDYQVNILANSWNIFQRASHQHALETNGNETTPNASPLVSLSESTIKKGQRERRTVEITRMSFLLGLCTFSSDVREPLVGTGHAHIQHTTSSPSLDQSPTQNEY
jgi:hypothetical protein